MLDFLKGANIRRISSLKELPPAQKLFAIASSQRKPLDPSAPEDTPTLDALCMKNFAELSSSFKKNFRSNGYWTLREITEDPELTKGKTKPDPANGCYAGQEYSLPLSMYFMRTALLQNEEDLDEEARYMLYLQMCDDIVAGPLRNQLKEALDTNSSDPNFPLFPPQKLVEEICEEPLGSLKKEKPAPEEQSVEKPTPI